MSYHLGIDLGTTYTAAAITRDGHTRIVELGRRSATIPSVIFLREDETILAGDAADRRGVTEPGRVAREFKRRIGDPTPLMVGGVPYSADRLTSKLLRWVVDHVSEREGGATSSIAITHPANWGPFKKDLLEQAIRNADLEEAITLTEPEAAAIYYSSLARVEPGTVLGVYDLGGGTFDAAVLRKTPEGFEVLGRPEGIERLGGIDFDEAIFAHVRTALDGAIEDLDPDDPTAIAGVVRLRRESVEAKEALSGDTEAIIPVLLPTVQTDVRITRTEFEAMVRPSLLETIEATKRSFHSAGVEAQEVTSILLVGGSSRIPLVAQMVASHLSRPISLDVHPKHAIPLGAAMLAAQRAIQSSPPGPATSLPVATTPPTSQPELSRPTPTPVGATPPTQAASVAELDPVTPAPPVAPTEAKGEEHTAPAARAKSGLKLPPIALGGIAAVILLIVAFVAFGGGEDELPVATTTTIPAASTTTVSEVLTTEPPTTSPATVAVTVPATTSTTSTIPLAAPMPNDIPAIRITSIDLIGDTYSADYETNFDPVISSNSSTNHLHFFWDLYDPSTVGTNEPSATRAPWKIWDKDSSGTQTFNAWSVADRPPGASAICVVPATSDHQVANVGRVGETHHCMELPPVVAMGVGWLALQPGDCLTADGTAEVVLSTLSLSNCLAPHDAELFAIGIYSDKPWPGLEALAVDGDVYCLSEFAPYVGIGFDDSALFYDFLMPTEESWALGDREVLCILFDEVDDLTFPVAGLGI